MDESVIEGVVITPLRRIEHPKGDVLHAMKSSSPGYAGFGEAYFSIIHHGAIKGWKRHARMTLNLVVPVGGVRFVIHDDRPGSQTSGSCQVIEMNAANYARLTVPPGVWVAFQGVGPGENLVLNLADMEHDPAEADNCDLSKFEFVWES